MRVAFGKGGMVAEGPEAGIADINLQGRRPLYLVPRAVLQDKSFEKISDADWDHMLVSNLRSAFSFSQEVIPHMIKHKWGRIVNVVSIRTAFDRSTPTSIVFDKLLSMMTVFDKSLPVRSIPDMLPLIRSMLLV